MVTVIATPIRNVALKRFHWDLIEETCRSFGVQLQRIDDLTETNHDSTVMLSPFGETEIAELTRHDLLTINTVLLGCDDDWRPDVDKGLKTVRIKTPVDYPLWSGVALGIFLHYVL